VDQDALPESLDQQEEDPYLCETPFGTIRRKAMDEQESPSLNFVHHRSKFSSMTLLQDGKYGFVAGSAYLAMRVLRSSFDPDHAPEVAKSSFRYGVHFHQEVPSPADLVRLGMAFNHPLIVFPANLQTGSGKLTASMGSAESSGPVPVSIKPSYDGEGLIVRFVEFDGVDSEAFITFASPLASRFSKAQVVDLMERPTGAQARWAEGALAVSVRAHSFVSVKLT